MLKGKLPCEITVPELCKGLPVEFSHYIEYCRNLRFDEKPNYKQLSGLFVICLKRHGFNPKIPSFIWTKSPEACEILKSQKTKSKRYSTFPPEEARVKVMSKKRLLKM